MSATEQNETWKPAVGRVMATWGVSHASLESSIAELVACAVKEERERCCQLVFGHASSDNVAQRTVDAIRDRKKR